MHTAPHGILPLYTALVAGFALFVTISKTVMLLTADKSDCWERAEWLVAILASLSIAALSFLVTFVL